MDSETPTAIQPQLEIQNTRLCLRCNSDLRHLGRRAFHEPSMWVHGFFSELCSAEKFDVYFCSQCGSISLFIVQ
jgi:hypothetical protein